MIDSMIGGFDIFFDVHLTIKLAPDPPASFFRGIINRVDASGPNITGSVMKFFNNFPWVS